MNRYIDNIFDINIMGIEGLDLKKKIIELNGKKTKYDKFQQVMSVVAQFQSIDLN